MCCPLKHLYLNSESLFVIKTVMFTKSPDSLLSLNLYCVSELRIPDCPYNCIVYLNPESLSLLSLKRYMYYICMYLTSWAFIVPRMSPICAPPIMCFRCLQILAVICCFIEPCRPPCNLIFITPTTVKLNPRKNDKQLYC